MTSRGEAVEIVEVPESSRSDLLPILEDSFEGMYLWHSRRTLRSISLVKAARIGGENAGLAMLKMLDEKAAYVYYIAVSKSFRRRGIGGLLLDDALSGFLRVGAEEAYASVEEDNAESNALFASRGFGRDEDGLIRRYGRIKGFVMAREMMIVRGEVLLSKKLVPPSDTEGRASSP